MIEPDFEAISKEYTNTNVIFVKVDSFAQREVVRMSEVSCAPIVVFFKGGHKVDYVNRLDSSNLKWKVTELKSKVAAFA